MELIDKDALLAEIESRIKSMEECFNGKFPMSQSVKETEQDKGKLIAYKSILSFIDSLPSEEEPTPKVLEDMFNAKSAAESLGISQEEYDKIVDECIYGKEPVSI